MNTNQTEYSRILDSSGNALNSSTGSLNVDVQGAVDTVLTQIPTVSSHRNLFSGVTTAGANEASNSIDCQYIKQCIIYGDVDVATTITVQYGEDNSNWFTSGNYFYSTIGAESFEIEITSASARYYRCIVADSGTTINLTLAGK